MKKVYLYIWAIVILILENSITNYISIFGVTIDFLLIFLTIVSLYLDELQSSVMGAIIGLMKDITVGGIFGLNGLIYFLICYIISFSRKKIYKESKNSIMALILYKAFDKSILKLKED